MAFKTYVVESLNDYITLISQIYNDDEVFWYRGQSNAEYRLVPSGLREMYAIEDARGNEFEHLFLIIPVVVLIIQ